MVPVVIRVGETPGKPRGENPGCRTFQEGAELQQADWGEQPSICFATLSVCCTFQEGAELQYADWGESQPSTCVPRGDL